MSDQLSTTSQRNYAPWQRTPKSPDNLRRVSQHINAYPPAASPPRQQVPDLPPLLRPLLEELSPFPPYSAMIGMCDDDLPMLFDLSNPAAGSVLILGDSGFANSLHLKTILTSIGILNTKEEVNFHLISPHQELVGSLVAFSNFHILFEPDMPDSITLIEEIAKLIEKRHNTGSLDPVQVFAIDGLDLLFDHLDDHHRKLLHWIAEMGPELGVWLFATIETNRLNAELLPIFKTMTTRVFGKIKNTNFAYKLTGSQNIALNALTPGIQAALFSGNSLIRIWVPRLEEDEDFLIEVSSQPISRQMQLPFNNNLDETDQEDFTR